MIPPLSLKSGRRSGSPMLPDSAPPQTAALPLREGRLFIESYTVPRMGSIYCSLFNRYHYSTIEEYFHEKPQ